MCARMIEENRTHDQDRNTTSTQPEHWTPAEKGGTRKSLYIGIFADNEKKYKKKLKKIWK